MRKLVSTLTFLSMISCAMPALALEMHCHVNADLKSSIDGMSIKKEGINYKFKVKDTFTGIQDSVSSKDYNNFVNIKFGAEKTTKKDINVQVRPRKSSECLNAVYNDSKKMIWGGAYCDIHNHKKASSVTLRATDTPLLYSAAGAANTTTTRNTFMAFYYKPGNEFILSGVCVEN